MKQKPLSDHGSGSLALQLCAVEAASFPQVPAAAPRVLLLLCRPDAAAAVGLTSPGRKPVARAGVLSMEAL